MREFINFYHILKKRRNYTMLLEKKCIKSIKNISEKLTMPPFKLSIVTMQFNRWRLMAS